MSVCRRRPLLAGETRKCADRIRKSIQQRAMIALETPLREIRIAPIADHKSFGLRDFFLDRTVREEKRAAGISRLVRYFVRNS
jgi:hypothetical protein